MRNRIRLYLPADGTAADPLRMALAAACTARLRVERARLELEAAAEPDAHRRVHVAAAIEQARRVERELGRLFDLACVHICGAAP